MGDSISVSWDSLFESLVLFVNIRALLNCNFISFLRFFLLRFFSLFGWSFLFFILSLYFSFLFSFRCFCYLSWSFSFLFWSCFRFVRLWFRGDYFLLYYFYLFFWSFLLGNRSYESFFIYNRLLFFLLNCCFLWFWFLCFWSRWLGRFSNNFLNIFNLFHLKLFCDLGWGSLLGSGVSTLSLNNSRLFNLFLSF